MCHDRVSEMRVKENKFSLSSELNVYCVCAGLQAQGQIYIGVLSSLSKAG